MILDWSFQESAKHNLEAELNFLRVFNDMISNIIPTLNIIPMIEKPKFFHHLFVFNTLSQIPYYIIILFIKLNNIYFILIWFVHEVNDRRKL